MIEIIKNRIFLNIFSLSTTHFLNYLFPLIIVPYIVRVIGVEKYGIINFVQAVTGYFVLFVSFGMSITGPKDIAVVRDDNEKLSKVFSVIFFSRLYLSIFVFLMFVIVVFFVEKFRSNFILFFISGFAIFQNAISSYHFFRGIERMEFLAFFSFISRFIFMILTFILVKDEQDFKNIIIIDVCISFIISVLLLWATIFKFKVKLVLPKFIEVVEHFKRNISIFLSEIYVLIYTSSYTVILGFFYDYSFVGYYTAALKLINVWLGFENTIITTFFPNISNTAILFLDKAYDKIKKLFYISLYLSIPAIVFFILFSNEIVKLFLGAQYIESINVLRILSFLNLFILLNVHLTFNGMLALGDEKGFNFARLYGALSAFILAPFFIYFYKHIGAALSYVLSEIFVFIYSLNRLTKRGVNFLDFNLLKIVFIYIIFSLSILILKKVSIVLSSFLFFLFSFFLFYFSLDKLGLNKYFIKKNE
ncbi:MAG: oligosaccharide flippase family protein [Elusimicrobiales bacterium]|nr:oligosaccharide flippase family protein [Elusimicrobiales bacterium]